MSVSESERYKKRVTRSPLVVRCPQSLDTHPPSIHTAETSMVISRPFKPPFHPRSGTLILLCLAVSARCAVATAALYRETPSLQAAFALLRSA